MKFLDTVLPLLVVSVVTKSAVAKYDFDLENNPAYGYLTKVGVPLARKIRAAERASPTTNVDPEAVEILESPEPPTARIVNSYNALASAQFPYQAGLLSSLPSNDNSVCGGSLVSIDRVLTAAHCWWDGKNQASYFTVVLGSLKLFSGGTRLNSSKVVMHSQWDPKNILNDIAMIHLPYEVKLSNEIKPISLPPDTYKFPFEHMFTDEEMVFTGFGLTHSNDKMSEDTVLKFGYVRVISNTDCSRMYENINSSVLCTSGPATCRGDFGGPLVTKDYKHLLVGVAAFGPGNCATDKPYGFSRITYFLDWIKDQIIND